jgi:6-phosphogluconolactonase
MNNRYFAVYVVASLALAACDANVGPVGPGPAGAGPSLELAGNGGPGAVYTLSNEATGNAVLVFPHAANGSLGTSRSYPTGGLGTGRGLGSQGALALSEDGVWLIVVNAGSNDVSVFRVTAGTLTLTDREPSGGSQPISVTVSRNLVYVLNAGGTGNISGLRLDPSGRLTPITGSTRALSGDDVQPAQVSLAPGGRQLVVTEKATNRLDLFPVNELGVAGPPSFTSSAGGTPFGFAFGPRGLLFVSEAAGSGSASSYRLGDGEARVITGALAANQGAPCWAAVTADGRFGYTGNGAGSVTGFAIAPSGALRLLADGGATALLDGGVNDIALNRSSRYLYVLQVGGTPGIHAYRVDDQGRLDPVGAPGGLPASAQGLVAD